MKQVLLGDLFELKYGKSLRQDKRAEGSIPVYGSNGQIGFHNESLVVGPTIVVGRKGSIGEIHFSKESCWPIDTTYFVETRETYEVDLEWLFRLLKSLRLSELNRSAAVPGLNREDVYRISVTLPPLDDQKRIAYLLGKVEELISRRKQQLLVLEEVPKSVFMRLFGKYLRDEETYKPITEACDFIDYRGKTPLRTEAGIPLINAKCVRRGYFDAARLDFISDETYKKIMTRGFPKANDVLFTTEGATFGYTCRIPRDFRTFAVGQRLITLVCKDGVQPEALEFILNDAHIQKKLSSRLSGSAALGIRSSELAKVAIPFPPSGVQIQFSSIVEKIESIRSTFQQSLTNLQILSGALSQQAFRGELNLSRVPLPHASPQEVQPAPPIDLIPPAMRDVSVHLPDTDLLPMALESRERVKDLLEFWLEAYRGQLSGALFSAEAFMAAAETRLAELYPDNDFELRAEDYEHIKSWVFAALGDGRVTQGYADADNRVVLNGAPVEV